MHCKEGHSLQLKQRSWSSQVIHDFAIMESISMDLKVMPTSFRGYNYLLVLKRDTNVHTL